jgi:D-sedoheptulose 7-phosphate isomerase
MPINADQPLSNLTGAEERILNSLNEAAGVLATFMDDSANLQAIANVASLIYATLSSGGKIISCGNGGSHADAMHFAEELSGRYRLNRPALAAMAISDPTHITCVSNDFGFDKIFSRFIEGLGREGDLLLGISTSGNSENIIQAVQAARSQKMKVVLLLGKDGGRLASTGDAQICVPHFGYADRIQEVHIKVIHILIELIEASFGY